MNSYFLQFDFWNKDLNKFFFGVVSADLKQSQILEICKDIIREEFHGICPEEVEIKVNALNNINL